MKNTIVKTWVSTLKLDVQENSNTVINKDILLNNKYKIQELLSDKSGEADIYIVSYSDEKFVAKIYRSSFKYDNEKIQKLRSLKSKYIISILDEGWFGDRYFEIIPYFEKGDLTVNNIDEKFLAEVVIQNINEALAEIHNKGLIHRDIKPDNIYLSNSGDYVVVGDFGIASSVEDKISIKKTSTAFSYGYSGPEAYDGYIFKETDYYSLGITLLHLCIGQYPFYGMTSEQILRITCFGNLNIPDSIDRKLANITKGLTVKDRNHRWGNDEINRWLKGENIPLFKDDLNDENILLKGYNFNNKSLTTLKDLAYELAMNWNEGKKHFYRGYLEKFFSEKNQELASNIKDCYNAAELKALSGSGSGSDDIEFFKVIYYIYPETPLFWREEKIGGINELISKVQDQLPNINESYKDLILSGNLQFYLSRDDQANKEKEIDLLNSITRMAESSADRAYFEFALFNCNEFKFNGYVCKKVDDLVKCFLIIDDWEEIKKRCEELVESDYFYMWMKNLGHKDKLDEILWI